MVIVAFLSWGICAVIGYWTWVEGDVTPLMIMRYSRWRSKLVIVCQLLYFWMDLSGEICQGEEMVRYLYPKDGILHGITMEKCILLTTTVRKQRGLTRETGKQIHPTEPHVKLWIPHVFILHIYALVLFVICKDCKCLKFYVQCFLFFSLFGLLFMTKCLKII